jgi:hypothetical protein
MILKFLMAYFQVKARQYRSAGFSYRTYYPLDSIGYARGEVFFKMGNVYRALSQALCKKEK